MRRDLLFAAATLVPVLLASIGPGALAKDAPGPPAAPVRFVTDRYFDVDVADPYRWLEDGSDAAVKTWSEAQNGFARFVLDGLPGVAALRERVRAIAEFPASGYSSIVRRGSTLFAIKNQPPRQQSFLVVLPSPEDPAGERVIVDPNAHRSEGRDRDRLVRAVLGRPPRCRFPLGRRKRGRKPPRLRDGDRPPALRRHPACQRRHRRGRRGVERRRHGLLLHALPARRGACGRRPRLLSAGLLPPHRDPDESDAYAIGKDFPRIAETTLEASPDGALRPGLGQERRRWRALAVPPHAGRPLDPTRRRRGPGRRGTLRLRRLALSALAPRRLRAAACCVLPAGEAKLAAARRDRGRGRRLPSRTSA